MKSKGKRRYAVGTGMPGVLSIREAIDGEEVLLNQGDLDLMKSSFKTLLSSDDVDQIEIILSSKSIVFHCSSTPGKKNQSYWRIRKLMAVLGDGWTKEIQ